MNDRKKTIWLVMFAFLFLLAACTSSPTARTEEIKVITVENIAQLEGKLVAQMNEPASVRWTLDGKDFWLKGEQKAILYDRETCQPKVSYELSEEGILYDLSPDGKLIAYVLGNDPTIILYDVIAQKEVSRIPQDLLVQQALFSPDGSMLGIANPEMWEITLWDIATGKVKQTLTGFETAAPVYSFQFGADGKTILWIARGTIQPMQIANAQLGPELSHEDFINSAALSLDGKLLATASAGTIEGEFMPLVTLWDVHSGEVLAKFSAEEPFNSLDFSPLSELLAAGNEGKVLFWNTAASQKAGELITQAGSVSSLRFSADGSRLLTCTSQGAVELWQMPKER